MQSMAPKKALIVCTSVEKYPNLERATGLWFGEAAHFYEVMEKAGIEVDICSPRGGYIPIEPLSLQSYNVPTDWKYYADPKFRMKLGASLNPDRIKPEDYSIIYFAGGHGVMWDFPHNTKLQEISRKIYENKGVVSSVCHGAVGLLNIRLSDESYLINGKKLTGFSNQVFFITISRIITPLYTLKRKRYTFLQEETILELTKHVPFSAEDELTKRGAVYEKAPQPFAPYAVADGRLVTGQNPASGGSVAEKALEVLGIKKK